MDQKKYHINPDTGKPGICGAQIKCRFKIAAYQHFPTKQEAEKHIAKTMLYSQYIRERKNAILPSEYFDINGTHLVGYVDISYSELVDAIGDPTDGGDGDKVRVNWSFQTPFGIGTIYDWKESQPVELVTDWHIGGTDDRIADWVKDQLRLPTPTDAFR